MAQPADEPSKPTLPETKVDVLFININAASDFRVFRTATTDIHKAITQVDKHVHRGLYSVVSMNATAHSCTVVFTTERQRAELVWKKGFPWDIEEDPQPAITI